MKIVGLSNGAHDSAYAILEDGICTVHEELERFTRRKEERGDIVDFLFSRQPNLSDAKYFVHFVMNWQGGLKVAYPASYARMESLMKETGARYLEVSHHMAHAANAFFSSTHNDAVIVTIDGGGEEHDPGESYTQTCFSIFYGRDNKIRRLHTFPFNVNVGGFWDNMTEQVFGLHRNPGSKQSVGNQCGTVMAMVAYGNPLIYRDICESVLLSGDFTNLRGMFPGILSEQDLFDISAAMQEVTEHYVRNLITPFVRSVKSKTICFSGGSALNSLMVGKVFGWFPEVENVYVPPVPYDAGLAIGAAQYVYHVVENKPRVNVQASAYLGVTYSKKDVEVAIVESGLKSRTVTLDEVVNKLNNGDIVALFAGGSESGRRALGNRSIVADPRCLDMKQKLNEKVKHRKWYRPFAPSILAEDVSEWFETSKSSPYMGLVLKFKEAKAKLVPAVVHCDRSARLQTVSSTDNEFYYNLLTAWKKVSGVPVLLNTSFNDQEPIVETPSHALNCFKRTNIDGVYFADYNIFVTKE